MPKKEEEMPEFMQTMEDMGGFSPIRGLPINEAAVAQANDLLTNANRLPQHQWEYLLREAVTTTDFPYLFGQILDRSLLARYQAIVPDWRSYTYVGYSRDFRQKELHKLQGLNDILDPVAQKGEYLVKPTSDSHYHLKVAKYGNQFDISWESLINDDLGAFSDVASRFADAATYTEAYLATQLFVAAAGPNPLLFGATISDVDGQAITNQGTLALDITNLGITMGLMAAQTDVLGRPLGIRGVHLVVPPALEITARGILTSALQQQLASAVPIATANVVAQMGIQLHVNPFVSMIDTSGNKNMTWYLFADTGSIKAMEFDYLRGHETPEICMKNSDKVSPTGAPLGAFSGDFATDNIFYRVRIVCGGTQLDPRAAYAQVDS